MDQDESVSNFAAMTGLGPAAARQMLEASNWNVETAANLFFTSGDNAVPASAPAPQQPQGLTGGAYTLSGQPAPASSGSQPKKSSRKKQGGIATLGSLRDDSDDEDNQNYYAGGEKSGLAVADPNKRRVDPDLGELPKGVAGDLFARAKADYDERGPAEPPKPVGHTLGYTAGGESSSSASKSKEQVQVKLTFYDDGFTVDDGPVRPVVNGVAPLEADQKFLDDCNKGLIPAELRANLVGQEVTIALSDKRGENAPKPKFKAFQSAGNTLGSTTTTTAAAQPAPSSVDAAAFSVDLAAPTTSIQIRLADGTKLVSRFNLTHSVGDIRNFIASSRPNSAGAVYDLATTFPRKVLDDPATNIKEAGLEGAVVQQIMR